MTAETYVLRRYRGVITDNSQQESCSVAFRKGSYTKSTVIRRSILELTIIVLHGWRIMYFEYYTLGLTLDFEKSVDSPTQYNIGFKNIYGVAVGFDSLSVTLNIDNHGQISRI